MMRQRVGGAAEMFGPDDGSVAAWGSVVLDRLHITLDSLASTDIQWWRAFSRRCADGDDLGVSAWHSLSEGTALDEVLAASDFLRDLFAQLKD